MAIVGALRIHRFRLTEHPRQIFTRETPGVTCITDTTPEIGCVGLDWRTDEPTPDERQEFSWYSDCPETIGPNDGGTPRFLMYSAHQFAQPLSRWLRLYVYHLAAANSPQRIVRIGVFNTGSQRPLEMGVSIVRAESESLGYDRGIFAQLAALSVDQEDQQYPAVNPAVRIVNRSFASTTTGWTIIDTITATEGHMLHRIYELCIRPGAENPSPSYVVAAFTVPAVSSPDIDVGAEGESIGRAAIWPGDSDGLGALNRLGVWRYSYVVQRPLNGNPVDLSTGDCFYLEISPRLHRLGNGDPRPASELLQVVRGRQPRHGLGAYPLWTRVELTFCGAADDRAVQLWLDNPFPAAGQGYWGAVKLLDSTGTNNWGLQPNNTAIVPHIGASTQVDGNSAFLDHFQVPSNQDVTRRYLFMHGGGASMPVHLAIDARVQHQRPVLTFPGT